MKIGDLKHQYSSLKSAASTRLTEWQDVSEYLLPRASSIQRKKTDQIVPEITDYTGLQSNNVLAAGQLSYLTPVNERWFTLDSAYDEAKEFLRYATEQLQKELLTSNFYTELHEAYINRGAFGVCCLMIEEDKDENKVVFRNIPVGSFYICENKYGYVDTVYRCFEMEAKNILSMFGDKSPESVLKVVDKEPYKKFNIVHCVLPNKKYSRNENTISNKKFVGYYFCEDDDNFIEEEYFFENPYIVSRFLKCDTDVYGTGPGIEALPLIKQVNVIETALDILAEKMANPPILASSNMDYEIDSRAGGITFYDASNPNAVPREWQTSGRYDVGLDRINQKRDQIKEMFYVPIFNMLQMREAQKTATEVIELTNEKLVLFSPAMSRLTSELLTPLLDRCFGIILRAGKLGQVPQVLLQTDYQITYTSKIALSLKSIQLNSMMQLLNIGAGIVQMDNSVLDQLDLGKMFSFMASALNTPTEVMRTEEEITSIREQRATAMEEQKQMEQASQVADIAAQASKASPILSNLI